MIGRWIAETFLSDQINTITALDVYRHPAPLDAPYPHVTIALRGGTDIRPVGGQANVERLTYDISFWNAGSNALPLFDLNAAIMASLDSINPQVVTVDESDIGEVLSCVRVGAVPITTVVENGKFFQRDGYIWELYTRSY